MGFVPRGDGYFKQCPDCYAIAKKEAENAISKASTKLLLNWLDVARKGGHSRDMFCLVSRINKLSLT